MPKSLSPITFANAITSKEKLKEVFKDTKSIFEEQMKSDPVYAENIKKSKIFAFSEQAIGDCILPDLGEIKEEQHEECTIIMTPYTTLNGLKILKDKNIIDPNAKITVVNFANAFKTGGGVQQGSIAQEEYLCRLSDLFASLIRLKLQFYEYNHNHRNDNSNIFGFNRVISSIGVTQIKNDDFSLIEVSQRPKFNVISAAAPDLRKIKKYDEEKLFNVLVERIKLIFTVAISNQDDTIVLGAFGCGAFKVPPDISSRAFFHVLQKLGYKQKFKCIIFNIYAPDECGKKNLQAFKEKFKDLAIQCQ
ncbi:MAG: TIGR02452 family protein [Oscillospiraceae bacterium]|jgi:uncharacterized protein (TIGR02452 family)|nr:TIGR02452 family protein [Oscillospiraceae bacterium]